MLCISKFHVIEAQTRVVRLRLLEGPNAGNQIAVCAFHSFFVEGQTKLGRSCTCRACVIATWKLGSQAPLDAHS